MILSGVDIKNGPTGPTSNPAKAVIDQFYKALAEINQPNKQAWAILLGRNYGPSIITQCENYIEMSKNLVREWLVRFMFKDLMEPEKSERVTVLRTFWLTMTILKAMVATSHERKQKTWDYGFQTKQILNFRIWPFPYFIQQPIPFPQRLHIK